MGEVEGSTGETSMVSTLPKEGAVVSMMCTLWGSSPGPWEKLLRSPTRGSSIMALSGGAHQSLHTGAQAGCSSNPLSPEI